MIISAILAMSENLVIGYKNQLPWHLPADLQHFKKTTMGKPILMGRKTFESIGKVLPGRLNVVITRDKKFIAPKGCLIAHSIESALTAVGNVEEIFVIGGASLLQEMLPLVSRLYLTVIHHKFEGDVFFPQINMNEWTIVEEVKHLPDQDNKYSYDFISFVRIR